MRLTESEQTALHEILTWLRQPGNNRHCFFGDELESFDTACRQLMNRIKSILPEGCPRARIRATTRVSRKLEHGTLQDTMGDENRGMVVVDFDGHPHKYDQLQILSDVVAKEVNVLKIDVPAESGRGWKRTYSEISTQDQELGQGWTQQISQGAKYILRETWVRANEPHYVPTLAGPGRGASYMLARNNGSLMHVATAYAMNCSRMLTNISSTCPELATFMHASVPVI